LPFAAAVADAGVCARTWAAVRERRNHLHLPNVIGFTPFIDEKNILAPSLLTGIRVGLILRTLGRRPERWLRTSKGIDGPRLQFRDLYVLLSRQHSAGVYSGLDSELESRISIPDDPPAKWLVGFYFFSAQFC
jgi:hypothetical protein